jgi:hypothetical protein
MEMLIAAVTEGGPMYHSLGRPVVVWADEGAVIDDRGQDLLCSASSISPAGPRFEVPPDSIAP